AVLVVISAFAYYIMKFFKLILSSIERGIIGFPGFYQEWAKPTYQIVQFLIITGAIAIAVPYLPGAGSPALQGISIFLGIFVSLGATAVVANVFAGLALTYTRAFHPGDRVKIADTTGDVVERTFLVTRVCTPKNVVVTIPNSMVLANHIVNFSAAEDPAGLILHTTITLGYDVPWPKVHEVLVAAALATRHIMPEPSPFVLQTSLGDFNVSYEINAYTDQPSKMMAIYSELHQQIQNHCNEADIEILSPHYAAVRDGNQTTIPEDYLPKSYSAPGFRINPLSTPFQQGQANGQKEN
ncbi:MAG: mechanosensitive ion channel family protein, partial [Cyanobacteria bacterium P01_A01_bin.17]